MKNELDYVTLLKNAADTIIEFFNEAIAIAKKYEADESHVTEFKAMVDKIKPAGITYSAVHEEVACNMGMDAFFSNEHIKSIGKAVTGRHQELLQHIIPLLKE